MSTARGPQVTPPDAPAPQTITGAELERRKKAAMNARWATEVAELKTEGRTTRHFRINPHE